MSKEKMTMRKQLALGAAARSKVKHVRSRYSHKCGECSGPCPSCAACKGTGIVTQPIGTRSPKPQPSDDEILDYIQRTSSSVEKDGRTWCCCTATSDTGTGRTLREAVIDSMRARQDRKLGMGEFDERYLEK